MSAAILCIDDDRTVADSIASSLGNAAGVIRCSDLEEAFEILVVEEPDLVVLEIRLESGNGLDFVERVRSQGMGRAATPMLVVTRAGRAPGLHGRAMQLGVCGYLTKPVAPRELAAFIAEQLDKSERADDPNEDSGSRVGIGAGRLSELPLAELLDRVHRRGESGVLIVGDAQERTGIQVRNGSPVAVSLPRREDIDEYLIRTGRIRAEERDDALSLATLGLSSIEEVLLDAGVVDETMLDEALREQADEAIFRLFELSRGRFRFEPGRRLKGARSLDVSRSAQSIIVRGVLAWAPLAKVRQALSSYADLYVAASPDPEPRFDDVPFSAPQREFVAGLDGNHTIGDFLDASEFEQRTLYAFAILGSIDLTPDPMIVLDEAMAPEPTIDLEDAIEPEPVASEPQRDREPAESPEVVERPAVPPALDVSSADSDLSYEETLFDADLPGSDGAEPIRDLSYEEDLFEQQAFDDDSFESEMVSEEPEAEALRDDDSLIDIDQLVAETADEAEDREPVDQAPADEASRIEEPVEIEAPEREVAADSGEPEAARDTGESVEPTDSIAEPGPELREAPEEPEPPAAPPTKRKAPSRKKVAAKKTKKASRKKKATRKKAAKKKTRSPKKATRKSAATEEEAPVPVEPGPPIEPEVETPARVEPAVVETGTDTQQDTVRPLAEAEAPAPVDPTPDEAPADTEASDPEPAAPAEEAEPPREEVAAKEERKPASDQYAIAPFGTIETNPAERALIAARVEKRMKRRYAHLVDRIKHDPPAVEKTDTPAPAADAASRSLEAESWFRKGRDLLSAKKYDAAVEAFGMSAHLDPKEGEYVAHLGYALYLSKPNDNLVRKEALEDIARGIKLSPDRELPYVYLGRIFKVQGELDRARQLFDRALKIRPHCREAAQEVRLMDMREKKKNTGLLGRLLK